MGDARIFKVLLPDAWASLQASGRLEPSGVDLRDGFIHLSALDQLSGTLEAHFADPEEVVLLEWNAAALGDALKWEASRGGHLFPHFYGVADVSVIVGSWRLRLAGDGRFQLPEGLA